MHPLPWHLVLLGGLRAESPEGGLVVQQFRTQKTGLLLAFLALSRGTTHSREALIDRFWPDDDLTAGRNSLRVALNALRGSLEPPPLARGSVLFADRAVVRLESAAVTVDVPAFEAAARAAAMASSAKDVSSVNGDEAARLLTLAFDAYGGPFLPGYYDDWSCAERDRLQLLFGETLRRLILVRESQGDVSGALAAAERLLAEDLEDDEIRERVARLRVAAANAAARSIRPPILLPFVASPCLGREAEIARIVEVFSDPTARLLTLTGPGGVGKTRLSLEAARAVAEPSAPNTTAAARGACFVPLTPLGDGARVPEAIRNALNLPREADDIPGAESGEGSLRRKIVAFLTQHPMLLVFDNFEHLAGDPAALGALRDLLRDAPASAALVTSQRRLALPGERVLVIGPLETPNASAGSGTDYATPAARAQLAAVPSVALFLERLRAVRPDFTFSTGSGAATVAALCDALEGLPLALELAAAWGGTLTPAEMLHRLRERFALLATRGVGEKTDRRRSLWATISWSYELLPPDLRRVFVALSVFRGGWTGFFAAAVCETPDIHEALARLRERSLVVAVEVGGEETGDDAPPSLRFDLLESLRDFGREQFVRDDAARRELSRRHAAHFHDFVKSNAARMYGADAAAALRETEREMDNFRAALDFAVYDANEPSHLAEPSALRIETLCHAMEMTNTLARFLISRGYITEGREWTRRLLQASGNFGETASPALGAWQATLEALSAKLALRQGDYAEARCHGEKALALWRERGDGARIADALQNLGNLAGMTGDMPLARTRFEESLAAARAADYAAGIATALTNLGTAAFFLGDYPAARACLRESLTLKRASGDRYGIALTLSNLGLTHLHLGDLTDADACQTEALQIRREIGDDNGIADNWEAFASLAALRDDPERAARLCGAAAALRRHHNIRQSDADTQLFDAHMARARAALGDARYDALRQEGESLPRDAVFALVN